MTIPNPQQPAPAPLSPGWSIANKIGPRAALLDTINATAGLPEHVKVFLAAELDRLPEKFKGARVDAHGAVVNGMSIVHTSVLPIDLVG